MSFHSVPITYAPKLDAIFEGRCTQTIRLGRRYKVGDEVLFFEWTGQPYRSKWGRRERVTLTGVYEVWLLPDRVVCIAPVPLCGRVYGPSDDVPWGSIVTDELARLDGIDPPTGQELKRVLEDYHDPLPPEGVDAQILRWEASE